MRKVLHDDIVIILHSRIFISRTLNLFSSAGLAREWQIGRRTMYRYLNPEDREKSREDARKTERRKSPTNCEACSDPIKGHQRCLDCSILLHTASVFCDSCLSSRRRRGTLLKV